MRNLLRLLVATAEKAANIARAIRREEELFNLLIEEKASLKKKNSFVRDFKTLADVLIQETVRRDVAAQFPEMASNIYGEESNIFTNADGESIAISIGQNKYETLKTLGKVLFPNSRAAELLTNEVHAIITLSDDTENEISKIPRDLSDSASYPNFGIWIDPIDATSEYIKGKVQRSSDEEEIQSDGGLACATVLIGLFSLDTGSAVLGIVNQPFWKLENSGWTGRHFWGLALEEHKAFSLGALQLPPKPQPVIMSSNSEEDSVTSKLASRFQLVHAPGAGYKLLCVITGIADFYVLSKDTTYLWDTCAPHAILKALGGGIDTLEACVEGPQSFNEISYKPNDPSKKFANVGGIFAYRNISEAPSVLELLRQ